MHIKLITKKVPMRAQSLLTILDTINAVINTLSGLANFSDALEARKLDKG